MDSSYLRGLRVALKASKVPRKKAPSKKQKLKTRRKIKGIVARSGEQSHEDKDILTSEIRASM